MCQSCYLGRWDAAIEVTPAVLECVPLIARQMEKTFNGGELHVVIDDYNLYDDSLKSGGRDSPLEAEIRQRLQAMTVPQRATTIALFDGYVVKTDSGYDHSEEMKEFIADDEEEPDEQRQALYAALRQD